MADNGKDLAQTLTGARDKVASWYDTASNIANAVGLGNKAAAPAPAPASSAEPEPFGTTAARYAASQKPVQVDDSIKTKAIK